MDRFSDTQKTGHSLLEPAGNVSVFSDAQDHGDVAKSLQRSGVDIPS